MYAITSTCMYVHTYAQIAVDIICVHTHLNLHACMHECIPTQKDPYIHKYTYVCIYIYIFIHMYMHITYTYPHMFYIFHRRFRNFATSHLSWGLPSGRGLEPSRGEGGCSNGVLGYGGFHKWGYLNRWEHGWEYDGNNVGCWLVTPPSTKPGGMINKVTP